MKDLTNKFGKNEANVFKNDAILTIAGKIIKIIILNYKSSEVSKYMQIPRSKSRLNFSEANVSLITLSYSEY